MASQPGHGFESRSRWLSDWGGVTLIEQRLRRVAEWGLARGVVVLGADAEAILDEADLDGFDVLIDPEWAEGEAASVRAGLDFLQRRSEIDVVVLVSADQETPPVGVVTMLLEERLAARTLAAVPKYRYAAGRPLVLHRDLWPRLLGLEATSGVEAVLATHAQWVTEVWFDRLPPRPVASPEDAAELAPRH
jgi:molybdenum cofactor cytidylyltransferase